MAADTLTAPASPGTTSEAEPLTSPLDTILMVSGGYCVPRALHVIAELGIADAFDGGAKDIRELARQTGTDADALGRMLRLLSAHSIFEADADAVRHNDASRLLRKDHPQSARALARMFGLEVFWTGFLDLEHSVRTGESATGMRYPDGLWAWLSQRPDESAIFNEAMTAKSYAQVASVLEAYDFSRFNKVADIGGGRGHLLKSVTDKWPHVRGILFDLPHVIADAEGLRSERLELAPGDFFKDDLPEADAYVLMEVIHDWSDPQALEILSAVERAAPGGATILLVEQLMPDIPGPHWVKMLDAHMLAHFAAKQRSAAEYERLLEQAGFKPSGVTDTFSGAAIVEAVKR